MNRFGIKVLVALGAIAMLAFVAGCGGSGDSTTDSGGDFAAQGNAICTDSAAAVSAVTKPTGADDLSRYLGAVAPLYEDAATKIGALTPPEDQQGEFDDFVSALDDQAAAFKKAESLAASDPKGAAATLNSADSLKPKLSSGATALGLTSCFDAGDGGGSSGGSSS